VQPRAFIVTDAINFREAMEKYLMNRMRAAWAWLIATLMAISAAQAQTTIDVSKISCNQLATAKVASPDYIAIWLSGFYNGKRNNTIIDVQQLQDNAQKIRSYCLYNGKGTVMEAVEKVLSKEK
jgi:acid stress chaperone HdeB